MVDIVRSAYAVRKAYKIVNGSENVFLCYMTGRELVYSRLCRVYNGCLEIVKVTVCLFLHFKKHCKTYFLAKSGFFLEIYAEYLLAVDHSVGNYLALFVLAYFYISFGNAGILDLKCFLAGKLFSCVEHKLAGDGVDNGSCKGMSGKSSAESRLLVELISAHSAEIVSLGIEESIGELDLSALHKRRFARTELSVYLFERFFVRSRAVLVGFLLHTVLCKRSDYLGIVAEKRLYTRLGRSFFFKSADKDCNRYFTVFVYTDVEYVACVRFVFKPCAAIRNYLRGEYLFARFVDGGIIIHTGRTDELRNDNAFCTVDNERAAVCHQREFTHKDVLLFYFAGRLVRKTDCHSERRSIVYVAFLAFFNGIFRFRVDRIADEFDYEIT